MLKIGLTGGIASGKSTICQLFAELGIPIIDADIIARQLVEPDQIAFTEIVEYFGGNVLLEDGSINRSLLRKRIFSDPEAKKRLESILHPKISQQLQLQSDAKNSTYCILAIPLLIESNLQKSVDRILVIDISKQQQLERLCQRDSTSPEEGQQIINSQCSREQRLSFADDIIINTSSIDTLHTLVLNLDKKYRKLALCQTGSCQHTDSHGQ
ncbi:MAG: dephospho-CoA kinase [Gammaproteobacteria bacterium]|nr:dephospho-CoA kinase [Gammaproteobacteria bacterium]